ncbi:RDD family protein [Yinghuangia sp. YIM S09857]|uniref:RDD family protein n=1 Tax=Yinghuangia sp. YIM S09857 TaxID=3436929 RepID=UPI003F53E1AD
MSDLVTGEAVALDLRPARLASRAIAFGLDLMLQAVCLLVFAWGLGSLLINVDPALGMAVGIAFLVVFVLGWPVGWETATRGRSPGKMAMGLRVVRDDGGPVRFRHALVRGLVGVFADFWTTSGCGAVISSLASTRGKRLGDQAAGTFVVQERTPGARHVPVAMHPAAAAWASGLDLSRLTDDLALQARQYLGRIAQLDPAVAAALGTRLAGEVAARIGVTPPNGVHPASFLAAVLAERQRRAYERVQPVGPAAPPPQANWGVPGMNTSNLGASNLGASTLGASYSGAPGMGAPGVGGGPDPRAAGGQAPAPVPARDDEAPPVAPTGFKPPA